MALVVLWSAALPAWPREITWHSVVPATAAEAAASLGTRRLDILNFNACGREAQFNDYMLRLRNGDFTKQGEDTSDLVLAKLRRATLGCEYVEVVAPNTPPSSALTDSLCADQFQGVSADGITRQTTRIAPSCLRKQVNEALQAYRRHDKLGSSGAPCVPLASGADPFASDFDITTVGEYDVDVAHVVRMMYLADRGTLDGSTRAHLWNELLSIRGAPGAESYSVLYDCGNSEESVGSPEHYADQEDGANSLLEDLGDAGEYLLKRLFLIALFYYTGGIVSAWHEVFPIVPSLGSLPLLGAATVAVDPFVFARVPETENHLLLIESSRFLTNQAMLADLNSRGLSSQTGDIARQQRESRDWLLKRLQTFAMNDFSEYNARAYQRYSLLALTNLYDFADDARLHTAAQIVLDYASAKAAVGSSLGRRVAPFRRLSDNDGFHASNAAAAHLYNRVSGADFGAARLMLLAGSSALEFTPTVQNLLSGTPQVLAGQTPLYAGEQPPGGGAGGLDNLVVTATSSYELPDPILELAVERPALVQLVRHAGAEGYSSGAGFLLTAGGLQSGYANTTYFKGRALDKGAAMPTTLLLSDDALTLGDVVRFDGVGIGEERTPAMCLTAGFACGVNVSIPTRLRDCAQRVVIEATTWTFVNTAVPACNALGMKSDDPHRRPVYIAIASRNCSFNDGVCGRGGPESYGFLEVVDAPLASATDDAAFTAFRTSRPVALNWPNGVGGTYRTSVGRLVEFSIPSASGPAIHLEAGGIRSIDGVIQNPLSSWSFLANGGAIEAARHDGVITITSPRSRKALTLDLHDWTAPTWSKNY